MLNESAMAALRRKAYMSVSPLYTNPVNLISEQIMDLIMKHITYISRI